MSTTIGDKPRRQLGINLASREAAKAIADAIEAASTAVAGTDQFLLLPLPDLDAGDDFDSAPLFELNDFAVTIQSIKLIAQGAFVGVDNSNTIVVTVDDWFGNVIVTKTYNAGTAPTDNGANALGALNATYKVLDAGVGCFISVTCGATADPPALLAQIRYRITG